jgi:NAD(P)-dependent dehydrogenase (short-subunit alcohol dehydrogenase family)
MAVTIDMSGKAVVVTGGGKGVGRGISGRFLEAGASVLVCGRTAPETLPEAAGRKADFLELDLKEDGAAEGLISEAVSRYGRVDVVVNNAGGSPFADAATASPRFSESIIRLNLLVPLYVAQQANSVMQEQEEGGVVLNIASVSADRPSPGTAAYGAAKAGLLSLTRTLAVEWAPKVRVVAVTAGMVKTEQSELHYGDEEGLARVSATVPLERMAGPRDVGDVCVFAASPLASYISGASLLVHGGGEKPAFLDAATGVKR